MRIISGRFKGRNIKMPRGIRPTQDKVRKALFDILGDIEGLSFLDLFAGSGAVGLEAISKGAKDVVFVEVDAKYIKVIKENFSLLSCLSYRVIESRADWAIELFYRDKKRFDIIFLDPPYYQDLALRLRSVPEMNVVESLSKKTLQILGAYDILTPNGFMVIQHFKKDILPNKAGDLRLFRQSRYGDTKLSFYRKVNPKSQ